MKKPAKLSAGNPSTRKHRALANHTFCAKGPRTNICRAISFASPHREHITSTSTPRETCPPRTRSASLEARQSNSQHRGTVRVFHKLTSIWNQCAFDHFPEPTPLLSPTSGTCNLSSQNKHHLRLSPRSS